MRLGTRLSNKRTDNEAWVTGAARLIEIRPSPNLNFGVRRFCAAFGLGAGLC
jgi:hypothetical protein